MIKVEIRRLPLTGPCPVPVTPAGETMRDDEPIPLEERPELCAVDAGWMVGAQRLCSHHLAEFCELSGIDLDGVIEETFEEYGPGAVADAQMRSAVPWSERRRYSQAEARDWHESAKEHGLT